MAGGIFPGRPFSWNVKCIVFSAVIAGGYWYLPPKNLWVLAFLLWLPYVAMTWYDYAYDCRDKMQPTIFPLGRRIFLPFKPEGYKKAYEALPAEQKRTMDRFDHVVTWTLAVALVAYLVFTRSRT